MKKRPTIKDLLIRGYSIGWYSGTCRDCKSKWEFQEKGSYRCKKCATKVFHDDLLVSLEVEKNMKDYFKPKTFPLGNNDPIISNQEIFSPGDIVSSGNDLSTLKMHTSNYIVLRKFLKKKIPHYDVYSISRKSVSKAIPGYLLNLIEKVK